ncbi:MAG: F0F1 ATP synthase subunit A [Oscillospiraceae bacterium]|nr:F0F1 ATP synthase subunit A [Oscillospiraceae bacterium]
MEFSIFDKTISITQSVTVQWLVVIALIILFAVLGRNLKVTPESKKQAAAEWIVTLFSGMVNDSMGAKYRRYTPYIGALFCYSICMNLTGLLGLHTPTSDISVIGAWGIITFVLVQRNRFKTGGLFKGLKSYADPVIVMLPMNLIGEVAAPVSQSFRHYGNILAGGIIMSLVYWALGNFAVALPAVLSLYFDLFGAVIQAFIFTMLTMVYISMAECD